MSESKATLAAKLPKLRKQLADAEATASGLKIKIAQIEAVLDNQPVPVSGLDALWKVALPISRNRSSKHSCRQAWNMIPKGERPTIETMIAALKIWNRCQEWKKDGNQFVPALDRWIKERRWEDLPEVPQASARYQTISKPIPQHDPSEEITDPAEIAKFLSLRPPRMNS
jgi:hypothetical protein